MNFFCTKKHYEDWAATHYGECDATFRLDLSAAVVAARQLFGPAG